MKAEWEVKTLGEVCEIKPPKAEARTKLNEKDLVSFVPMESLGINQKYLLPNQTRLLAEVVGSYTYFANDDVLQAKITPCFENGKLGIATNLSNGVGFGSSEYIIFRPNSKLEKEWLYYYISRQSFRDEGAERMAGAVGHKRVSKEFIENYSIPIPPIQEQLRIVAILDQAFEGIAKARANAEQNLQNARALFESHLQSVLTQRGEVWVNCKLSDVVEFDKTQHKPNNALPYVGMEDIESDTGKFVGRKEPCKVKSSTFHFNCSHVLYGRLRPYLNKVLLPDFEGHCSTEVFPLLPSLNLDRNFLFYWLTLNSTKEKINATCTGARMPRANMNDVLAFDFSYPSLEAQNTIVENLKALSKETQRLEANYQRKIALLNELKKSLLQQAFAGEL